MQAKLTKEEFNYLGSADFLTEELRARIRAAAIEERHGAGAGVVVQLSEDEADLIRDRCGEHLQVVGFDKDYKLTTEGKLLESIINKLFIG